MNTLSSTSIEQARQELLSGAVELADRARVLVRRRAVVRWLAFCLAVLGFLVFGDAVLRREELGLRLLSALVFLVSCGYAARRILVPAWRFNPTSLQVARWIEEQRPELGEQLSTVVQLAGLSSNENRFGSAQFRDSAIQRWVSEGVRVSWASYLDTRHWWRAVTVLLAVVFIFASAISVWPLQSWMGFQRLVIPWSNVPWPRRDQLVLNDPPNAIARGSELQIEIIDLNLPLPDEIRLMVRDANGGERISSMEAIVVDDIAVANLPAVESAIEVRAIGGDDHSMPWHRIEVVNPPMLSKFSFTIHPPEYSGRDASEVVGQRIKVLVGSRVFFQGTFTEPVESVDVKLLEPSTVMDASAGDLAQEDGGGWQASRDANGSDFTIGNAGGEPWFASRTLTWQLAVATNEDLRIELPDVWSVEVVQDAPPAVQMRELAMRELSAQAEISLQGRVTDDLGLEQVVARVATPSSMMDDGSLAGSQSGIDANGSAQKILWQAESVSERAEQGRQTEVAIEHAWDFSKDFSLKVGQEILVWLEATDTLGQVGKSQPQRLTIQNSDAVLYAIQERQRQMLERLRELVDLQRRNAQLATRATDMLEGSQAIDQEIADSLSSVAQIQASIRKQLFEGRSSVSEQLAETLNIIEQNRLEDSEQAAELDALAERLGSDVADSIAKAENMAAQASQRSRAQLGSGDAADRATKDLLANSAEAQAEALQQTQAMLDRMSRADSAQQVQRELVQMLKEQQQLKQETNALYLQDLSGTRGDQLEQVATGLSADQQSLARQLDRLVARIRELQNVNNAEAVVNRQAAISKAADTLMDQHASGLMRRSAEELLSQQLSSAAIIQEKLITVLQDALKHLGFGESFNRGMADRAEQLRSSSQALADLARKQAALADEIRAAGEEDASHLAEQQSRLQGATAQQQSQLETTGDTQASNEVRSALDSQRDSAAALATQQMSAATDAAQNAASKLESTAEALRDRSRELDSEAQQQQMFRLSTAIQGLVIEQDLVVGGLTDISEKLLEPNADSQEGAIRQSAAAQEAVRQMLREVRDRTDKLPAFDWTFEQTEVDMSRAVAAAQRFRVDPDALNAATLAARKLSLAAQAIADSASQGEMPEQSDEPRADDSPQQEESQRLVPPIASLRLLRGLQADINARTKLLDEQPSRTPGRSRLMEELASQQQALGQQLERLLKELAASQDSNQ